MPYRSGAPAPAEPAELALRARRPWMSPATAIALLSALASCGVFVLALVPVPPVPPVPARPALPSVGSVARVSPPGALGGLGPAVPPPSAVPIAPVAPSAVIAPARPLPPAPPAGPVDPFAPGAWGADNELELADGRYGGRVATEGLFGLAQGTRCEIQLAACAVEIRCGDRILYASGSDDATTCEHGASGGTTTFLDRGVTMIDGTPSLVLHGPGGGSGYQFELMDYGLVAERGYVEIDRAPAISIL